MGILQMDPRALVNDEKYEGHYVALKSFTDNTVVAFGDKPKKVINEAIKAGVAEPVIVYIPEHDVACLY